MEGRGLYSAARSVEPAVPVLLIKGICDWADGCKNDRAQPFAAAAAVSLVKHVFEKADALSAFGLAQLPVSRHVASESLTTSNKS
jgi:nucleoside phosphorylase